MQSAHQILLFSFSQITITFREPIFFSEHCFVYVSGCLTFFDENLNGYYSLSSGGNFIFFFDPFDTFDMFFLERDFSSSNMINFYDFAFLKNFNFFSVQNDTQSNYIYFFVAKPTVFLALSPNLAWGSLLFRNRNTLGHLIGSIKVIDDSSILNFYKLNSIPLRMDVYNKSDASGRKSSSTVKHILIKSLSQLE